MVQPRNTGAATYRTPPSTRHIPLQDRTYLEILAEFLERNESITYNDKKAAKKKSKVKAKREKKSTMARSALEWRATALEWR